MSGCSATFALLATQLTADENIDRWDEIPPLDLQELQQPVAQRLDLFKRGAKVDVPGEGLADGPRAADVDDGLGREDRMRDLGDLAVELAEDAGYRESMFSIEARTA